MKELIAKGKIQGKDVEVTCLSKGFKYVYLFNGKRDKTQERRLRELMKKPQRIANNYTPKTKKLKLCAIFEKSGFFDWPAADIEVYGKIEQIPYEDGVIY